ncbi:uncharacterized protein LOC133927608 [Phragmites australis]|uniref:uncharacterized protein LOC133927608 n=1 Tax=Phragmites australis TaxID=29695 RepID=UPI002D769CCA|nr:uncharacterized protein LOC133927608 [Phragmites australis]
MADGGEDLDPPAGSPRRERKSPKTTNRKGAEQDSDGSAQSTADMTAFVQNLLMQMQTRFQAMSENIISKIDEMGLRINELEQSINDLKAEMGSESMAMPSKKKDEESKPADSSATAAAGGSMIRIICHCCIDIVSIHHYQIPVMRFLLRLTVTAVIFLLCLLNGLLWTYMPRNESMVYPFVFCRSTCTDVQSMSICVFIP